MLEILVQGKWFMIPLMVCSTLAFAVLFDRAMAFLANRKIDTRALRANVLSLLERDRLRRYPDYDYLLADLREALRLVREALRLAREGATAAAATLPAAAVPPLKALQESGPPPSK